MQKNIAGVALPSVQSRASVGVHQTQVFQSKDAPDRTTTPDEFIRMTKGITTATAKAVAAGNSAQQEDVIATANLSRKAISDMLTTCKVLIHPCAARAAHAPTSLGLPKSSDRTAERGPLCSWLWLLFPVVTSQSHAANHKSECPSKGAC